MGNSERLIPVKLEGLMWDGKEVKPSEELWWQLQIVHNPKLIEIPIRDLEGIDVKLTFLGMEVGLEIGNIDILFIDERGLFNIVETKLIRNPQARREVIAQVIDYVASMTRVGLEKVIASIVSIVDSDKNSRHKQNELLKKIEKFMSDGSARLIIVTDQATESFLRVFNYFKRIIINGRIQLVAVELSKDNLENKECLIPHLVGAPETLPSEYYEIERTLSLNFQQFISELRKTGLQEWADELQRLYEESKDSTEVGIEIATKRKVAKSLRIRFFVKHDGRDWPFLYIRTDGKVWFGGSHIFKYGDNAEILLPFFEKVEFMEKFVKAAKEKHTAEPSIKLNEIFPSPKEIKDQIVQCANKYKEYLKSVGSRLKVQ